MSRKQVVCDTKLLVLCRMIPYVRNRTKKGKAPEMSHIEQMEGDTSSFHLKNTIREMMTEMLAIQNKPQEQPIISSVSQPEKVMVSEQTVMQKLSRFKKFSPPTFQEAKTPMEAEDWLEKLKKILDLLQADDNDRVMFAEFLLEAEASTWWKMEKRRLEGSIPIWYQRQTKPKVCWSI